MLIFQNKKPSAPSKFFVKNYLAGFANDPVLDSDNKGKTMPSPQKTTEETTKEEGQGEKIPPKEEGQGDTEHQEEIKKVSCSKLFYTTVQ